MADFAKVSRFLRRIGLTLVLAFVLACVVGSVNPDAIGIFVPSWIAFFVAWPFLDRKLNIPVFKGRKRPKRPTAWGRVIVTGLPALAATLAITLLPVANVVVILSGPLAWTALYHGWPALSRRLPLPEAWQANAGPEAALPIPNRTVWQLLGRGALATIGVIATTILLMAMTTIAALGHGMGRAWKVHNSIRVGMSVAQVLDASRDTDSFGASSDFPYDKNAPVADIPAMNLRRDRDGTYWTYDSATNQQISMTETQAVQSLRVKLHDGYEWRFSYTYLTMTPMHVSFCVIFGQDHRVVEVTPVHGWD